MPRSFVNNKVAENARSLQVYVSSSSSYGTGTSPALVIVIYTEIRWCCPSSGVISLSKRLLKGASVILLKTLLFYCLLQSVTTSSSVLTLCLCSVLALFHAHSSNHGRNAMTGKREQQDGTRIHAPVASSSAISRHSLDVGALVDAGLRSRPASPALSEDGGDAASSSRAQHLRLESSSKSKKRAVTHNGYGGLHLDQSVTSYAQLEVPGASPTCSNGNGYTYKSTIHPLAEASNASSGRSTPHAGFDRPLGPKGYGSHASYTDNDEGPAGERSPLLSVEVDRPSTPSIQQREYLRIPHDYDVDFNIPSFISTERGGRIKPPTLRSRIKLHWSQFWANAISTAFLLFIILWALTQRSLQHIVNTLLGKNKPRLPRAWDNPEKWKKEKLVKDVKYYARSCGYDIIDQTLKTDDGYYLRVHKVIVPSQIGKLHSDGKGGFPVIIQHGLFQSSGSFVTSEERSLAFWLAEKGGYQVYLSNGRAVFDMGHTSLKRSDPRL